MKAKKATKHKAKSPNPYDKVLKESLEHIFKLLVEKTEKIKIESYETLNPDLNYTIENKADYVFKIKNPDEKPYIPQIEFQSTNDAIMHQQMLLYAGLLHFETDLDIKQVLYYFGNDKPNMKTNGCMTNLY